MPTDKNFKRLVRERMSKTGESYVVARHHHLGGSTARPPRTEPMFTWPAAPALKLAQDEARLRGAGQLEPGHLLLGLLDAGGDATSALLAIGVSTAAVRAHLELHVPLRPSPWPRPAFSDATRALLAIATEEATERPDGTVDQAALLLAIASSVSPASAALAEFGATEERLRLHLETITDVDVDLPHPERAFRRVAVDAIGAETATAALADLTELHAINAGDQPTPRRVIEAVGTATGVPVEQITGASRARTTVLARQVAMHLLASLTDLDDTDVAELFGRHTTTVAHANAKITAAAASDADVAALLDELRTQLNDRSAADGA